MDIFLEVNLRRLASSGRFGRRAADGPRTSGRIKMNIRPSHNLDGLDIDMARHIDEVYRRFETDWREGRVRLPSPVIWPRSPRRAGPRSGPSCRPWSAAAPDGGGDRVRPSGSDSKARRSRNSPTAPISGPSVDDEAKVNTGRQCRETRLSRVGPTTRMALALAKTSISHGFTANFGVVGCWITLMNTVSMNTNPLVLQPRILRHIFS